MQNQSYQERLKTHLTAYAASNIPVQERGDWRGSPYEHILPVTERQHNFLPHCREALLAHLDDKESKISLHQFFHHLSSSQAFAFNLFFPFLKEEGTKAESFFQHFGSILPHRWWFEHIPDPAEKTNVDVAWSDPEGAALYCEVKLSETEFGTVRDHPKYQKKLKEVYQPRLESLVSPRMLAPKFFFAHYQLLRNLALLHRDPRDQVVFLVPKANDCLTASLERMYQGLLPGTRPRVRTVFIEPLLKAMIGDGTLLPHLREHAFAVAEKYLPADGQGL